MQEAFQRSNIPLYVATPMQYDAETQFNVKNASQYLGEVEEYISMLITQLAYKQDLPNAATAAIPFEKLPNKEFGKQNLRMDKDYKERETTFVDDLNQDEEGKNLAYNANDLRKKFMEKYKTQKANASVLDSTDH